MLWSGWQWKTKTKPMASATKHPAILIVFFLILCKSVLRASSTPSPVPSPWPPQFYSLLYMNVNGSNQIVDLWYDWPNGRNLNIIQNQLGKRLYDLEWDNGTSFFYTLGLGSAEEECRTKQFEVGILRPNWLEGAQYLGQRQVDGFLCNVWEKVDFIWYYEDVLTKRPVHWHFFNGSLPFSVLPTVFCFSLIPLFSNSGMSAHVMTFQEGAVREDEKWQAPLYCFHKEGIQDATLPNEILVNGSLTSSIQSPSSILSE